MYRIKKNILFLSDQLSERLQWGRSHQSIFFGSFIMKKVTALFLSLALAFSPAAFAQSQSSSGSAGAGSAGAGGAAGGAAAGAAAAGVTVGVAAAAVAAVAVAAAVAANKADPVYTTTGTGTNTSQVCIANC